MSKPCDWEITITFYGKVSKADQLYELLGGLLSLVPGVDTVSMRKDTTNE